MERLAVIDRKANLQIAGLRADYCSVHCDRDEHPKGFVAADFLPELREEEEAREAAAAEPPRMPDQGEFAAWRNAMIGPQTKVGQLAQAAAKKAPGPAK